MRKLITLCILTLMIATPSLASPIVPVKFKTSNGVDVLFHQAMEAPMLDIKLAFAAGSAYDGAQFGLSMLTTELLNQGNNGETATEIADQLADTGAQYQANGTRNMVALNFRTLTEPKALHAATAVFRKIITQPDFKISAFKREKNQQLLNIEHSLESPNEIANQTFFKLLYKDHPYAHPVMGTTDSIKEIKLEDVKRFYSTFFVDGNATLVLVGAIDKNQAKSIAEKLTKDLPRGPKAPRVSPAKALSKNMEADVPFPSSQTAIRLGELGISHHNKDYFPLVVGNYILGGGTLVSQLAIEVREKRGLTYGITSQFLPLPAIGPFIINLSTKASQSDAAIKLIRDILAQFVKQGPTDKELTAAKQYLTGSFPLSLSSNSNIARMLLQIQFYKLPEDYLDTYVNNINNVSTTDIKKAFQQNVWTDKMLLVTVGKS